MASELVDSLSSSRPFQAVNGHSIGRIPEVVLSSSRNPESQQEVGLRHQRRVGSNGTREVQIVPKITTMGILTSTCSEGTGLRRDWALHYRAATGRIEDFDRAFSYLGAFPCHEILKNN